MPAIQPQRQASHLHQQPPAHACQDRVAAELRPGRTPGHHPGSYTSVCDLNAKLRDFIDGWNARATPFTWTKTADQILAKAHCNKTSNADHYHSVGS